MKKQIVINASKDRSRIAIVEDGELVELYVENPDNVRTIGNIYLGRIQKVMPAIRAAFVDVGQKQDCFLHFSDLTDNFPQLLAMTGEEVPGLDEPVLSLAPSKRVADDEAEPDVEEKLEIEPAEDDSQSRRSRSRRARGRGRGRGRRSEEEEEQEEGRKLPSVIDLSSPARPRRPASEPTPEPDDAEAPSPEEEAPEASAPEAETSEADEAPAKPKRSRRGRSGSAKDEPSEADEESPDDDPEADSPEAASDTDTDGDSDEPKRRRRRRRGGRGRNRSGQPDEDSSDETASDDDATQAAATTASEADASDTAAEADSANRPKPLPASIDLTGSAKKAAPSGSEESASGRSRRRTRGPAQTSEESTDGAPASETEAETTDDDAPSTSRSRRGRGRSEDTEATDTPARSRRGRGGSAKDDDSDKDDAKDQERSGRRRGRSESSGDGKKAESRGRERSDRSRNNGSGRAKQNVPIPPNEQLLRRDGRIIVKITKEPISTKGPRVSTDLSLAGRFLVLVPAADYVAVSKKIESAKERRRLRTLAQSLKPEGFGVIVRTVAENRDAKSLDTDLRLLVDKWRKIEKKLNQTPEPPVLLYEDVNMVSSIIRDLFSDDYDRILVDDPKVFKNVQAYVKAVAPSMADKVELHKGSTPVYRALGIEKQVEEAFSKRVNMRGGGYLYIETTEAMHVVDVNSGRSGRGKSQKENLIAVNVEAAREVAKQLRLRDLGGIIVVDFIDLRYDRDRKKVTDALKEAFKKDRAVTKLLPMSDFGLVQITRQRLRPSITTQGDEDGEPRDASEAAAAAGAGEIRPSGRRAEPEPVEETYDDRPEAESRPTVAPEDATPQALSGRLKGWLDHYRRSVDERYKSRPIVVRVHPLFGAYLRRGFPSPLTRWRLSIRGIAFHLEEDAAVDPLAFDIRDQKSGRSLLKKYVA